MKIDKQIVCVTGLPRAGSTLLCQLLGMHPEVYSIGHSSPLATVIDSLRRSISDSPFLLGQLDVNFDLTYQRLINSYRGYINGWFEETELPTVVDKNRAWLGMLQTAYELNPEYKMIVCVRDPIQIYGSIETQHKKTILLDFPDHMNPNSAWQRGDQLFSPNGVIGGPLRAVENMQDIGPEYCAKTNVYYMLYERLLHEPATEMSRIFNWLKLSEYRVEPGQLPVKPHETDSYYRFKYKHNTHPCMIYTNTPHAVPARIVREVYKKYRWLYETFYPRMYEELKNLDSKEASNFGNGHKGSSDLGGKSNGETQDVFER